VVSQGIARLGAAVLWRGRDHDRQVGNGELRVLGQGYENQVGIGVVE
jgi:hypothetical protein